MNQVKIKVLSMPVLNTIQTASTVNYQFEIKKWGQNNIESTCAAWFKYFIPLSVLVKTKLSLSKASKNKSTLHAGSE